MKNIFNNMCKVLARSKYFTFTIISKFLKNKTASIVVEGAFLIPLSITTAVGTIEATQYVYAIERVDSVVHSAVQAVSVLQHPDLPNISDSSNYALTMNDLVDEVVSETFSTLGVQNLQYAIAIIGPDIDNDGYIMHIQKSEGLTLTPEEAGAIVEPTIKSQLVLDTRAVVGIAQYTYVPISAGIVFDDDITIRSAYHAFYQFKNFTDN